jgi:hypothetical protein
MESGRGYARQGYVFHDDLLSSIDSASSLEQIAVGLKTTKAVLRRHFDCAGLLADNVGLSSFEVASP